jgi:hypothetical protein
MSTPLKPKRKVLGKMATVGTERNSQEVAPTETSGRISDERIRLSG